MQPCPKESAPGIFRVTIHDSPAELRLAVEGRLTSAGARELEQCWRTAASTLRNRAFALDLDRVASIDEDATGAVERLHRSGAILNGHTPDVAQVIAAVTGADPVQPFGAAPASLGDIAACLLYRLRTWLGLLRPAPGT